MASSKFIAQTVDTPSRKAAEKAAAKKAEEDRVKAVAEECKKLV